MKLAAVTQDSLVGGPQQLRCCERLHPCKRAVHLPAQRSTPPTCDLRGWQVRGRLGSAINTHEPMWQHLALVEGEDHRHKNK